MRGPEVASFDIGDGSIPNSVLLSQLLHLTPIRNLKLLQNIKDILVRKFSDLTWANLLLVWPLNRTAVCMPALLLAVLHIVVLSPS